MRLSTKVQLTYIPVEYWNTTESNFTITTPEKSIPKDSDFFILWSPEFENEEVLERRISKTFPEIPTDQLLSCNLRLAFPSNKESFIVKTVFAKIVPISPTSKLLYKLDFNLIGEEVPKYSRSIQTWAFLTKFVFELLTRGNFVPTLRKESEKLFLGHWKLLLKTQHDNKRFQTILKNAPVESYNLPAAISCREENDYCESLWHPSYLFSSYMDTLGDLLIRSILKKSNFQTFKSYYSQQIAEERSRRSVSWDYRFLKSLLKKNNQFYIIKFHESIIPNIIQNWIQTTQASLYGTNLSFSIELSFPENNYDEWPLRFYIQLVGKGNEIPVQEIWKDTKIMKKSFLKSFEGEASFTEAILRSFGTAMKLFPPIQRALNSEEPHDIFLDSSEVMQFLKYPKDLLIQSGFNVVLPEGFSRGGKHRLSARLIIKSQARENIKEKKGMQSSLPSMFDINSMVEYQWKASLEEKDLTKKELKAFINSSEPLVKWRDQWVLLDPQDMEELREIINKDQLSGHKTYMDALKLGITGEVQVEEHGSEYEVIVEGELSNIIDSLQELDKFEEIPTPESFNGKLRPYQKDALSWMVNMSNFNFGLALADDMGLGKTIQIIAFLLYRKETYPEEKGGTLVVCPTSVLFNWKREIQKFAPDLDVIFHHGQDRIKDASDIEEFLKPHRVVLTSYGTLRNDIDFMQSVPFSGIVVDESQNIKNPSSQQTQAVYNLQGQFRICLSGTPIQNRLMELWSLFNFLNPGLLGTRSEFQSNYVLPIERYQDPDAIKELKTLINPFILRRVKTDESIISDLPEKNEMDIFLELTENQKQLYSQVVEETLRKIEKSETQQSKKKGLVLKLLTQLKQICNHPYQFKKKQDIDSGKKEFIKKSNKVVRLLEIIEEVLDKGEKILIFTQFRQMGDLLEKLFNKIYEFPILYFHGSVPEKKRRYIVDEFQSKDDESPPILILSLMAGGTGLNLTQGTTVVHFDRWWNPAVEDQATDRAYRIGQKSPVNVYKFITLNTIEEKINTLLEEKKELAESIVASSGEGWLSDLNFDKLKEIVTYSE